MPVQTGRRDQEDQGVEKTKSKIEVTYGAKLAARTLGYDGAIEVLLLIASGRCRFNEMCQIAGMNSNRMSIITKVLIKAGMVRKEGRVYALSDYGWIAARHMDEIGDEYEELVKGVTDAAEKGEDPESGNEEGA